eukprot:CAMPEP_0114697166 /NCGR_PEP_ID=MMETSP0191-20121206/73454_1 /TAXON_ID=126664 /ORGANISM="Sorites sp." /LENGTH=221 /DNA_ID=CAMNT_0001995873 /DNA_START=272 /DNA_END=937 /DNA_ORIENTATION=+
MPADDNILSDEEGVINENIVPKSNIVNNVDNDAGMIPYQVNIQPLNSKPKPKPQPKVQPKVQHKVQAKGMMKHANLKSSKNVIRSDDYDSSSDDMDDDDGNIIINAAESVPNNNNPSKLKSQPSTKVIIPADDMESSDDESMNPLPRVKSSTMNTNPSKPKNLNNKKGDQIPSISHDESFDPYKYRNYDSNSNRASSMVNKSKKKLIKSKNNELTQELLNQ